MKKLVSGLPNNPNGVAGRTCFHVIRDNGKVEFGDALLCIGLSSYSFKPKPHKLLRVGMLRPSEHRAGSTDESPFSPA